MIVISGSGAAELLNNMTDQLYADYRLFTNNLTPTEFTPLADFVEPDWDSYVTVRIKSWTPAVFFGITAITWSDPAVWTRGAGGVATVAYGYYVTHGNPPRLLLAERRGAGPWPMSSETDQAIVLPSLTLVGTNSGGV